MAANGYVATAKFRFSVLQAKRGPTIRFLIDGARQSAAKQIRE
ncbi:hypothetical protein ACT2FY_07715 [Paraburkholderia fungorum]